ncbi:MAG TPA: CvpA family protein [Candidatus Binatia bacterium]|nr:CvpA family protein [Candidatus Binatia bacterium]
MPGYGLNEAAADLVLVVIVGVNAYMGWRYGLVRRAIAFAAIFAGCVSATYVGNPVAALVKPDDLYANAWAFVGIFALVIVMIEILAALYADQIQKLLVVMFDRITGLAAGLLVGLVQVGVLCLVAQAMADVPASATVNVPVSHTQAATAVDHGVLTQLVVKVDPGIQALLRPAMPNSLEGRLAQVETDSTAP